MHGFNAVMPPVLVRILRYFMIGFGAITLVSAVVNIIGAVQLIDATAEESLGVTQREVILWFVGPGVLGLALMVFGFVWRRKK